MGRAGSRDRRRSAGRRVAIVPEHRQPSRVPVRLRLFLLGSRTGEPALSRLGCVRVVRSDAGRVFDDRTGPHARVGYRARAMGNLHGIRAGVRAEPRLGRRPLSGRGFGRSCALPPNRRSGVRVHATAPAREGQVAATERGVPGRKTPEPLEPIRTYSNLLEPTRTYSNLLEPTRTYSNLLEP
jgi:hypothetical protein